MVVMAMRGVLMLAAAVCLGAGAIYQVMGERRAVARYPCPGRLVEVDGVVVHALVEASTRCAT